MTVTVGRAPGLPLVGVPGERRLAPVSLTFALFGCFWGGWAVSAIDVERDLHLSDGGFDLLLSAALLGGAVGNAAGGAVNERFGTSRVLGLAFGVWGCLSIAGGLVHSRVGLGLLLIAFVAAGGLVDVSANVAATAALSDTPGYLVRFHARFNIGAAIGACINGTLIASHHGWRLLWIAVGGAALAMAPVCLRSRLPAGGAGESAPLSGAVALLRRERLVLIAVAFSIGAMVEGGIELWGVLYLRTKLESGLLVGAGGAVMAYLVASAARILLGPSAARRGAERGVLIGAGTAAAGAVILALAPVAVVAALGLVLAAGGISMCWPLLIARTGAGRERPGEAVGAVSAVGYLGLVAGPGLVGLVAGGVGLRWGLIVLAAAAVFVALTPTLVSARQGARRHLAS